MLGEDVGIGGDHAEKIIEGVRDDLSFRGSQRGIVGNIKSELHGRRLSKMGFRLFFRETRENGGVDGLSGELFERETTGGPHVFGLGGEIDGGGGIKGQNGESGVFGAHLVDIVETLKIPGMNIESGGVPIAGGQDEEEFVERLDAVNPEVEAGSVNQRLRDFGPGEVFAQKKNLKRGVVHWSFEQLLARNTGERS